MSEADALHSRHLDATQHASELQGQLEKLRETLEKYRGEEVEAKRAAKAGSITIDDLVAVQTRRKTTEDLIGETEQELQRARAEAADLERQIDHENAVQAVAELAREGDDLKESYASTAKEARKALRSYMTRLAKHRRSLARQRDEMVDALAVLGVGESTHLDDRAKVLRELEDRGIEPASIVQWPTTLDTPKFLVGWAPEPLRDAAAITNLHDTTVEQNLAHLIRELEHLAMKAERSTA